MRKLFIALILVFNSIVANAILLPDGTDAMVKDIEQYENGKIKSVFLIEPTSIKTPIGKFLFFERIKSFDHRESYSKIEFYENGSFKSGYLKEKTIVKTPKGKFSVSFLSFYENGKIESFSCPLEFKRVIKGSYFYDYPKNPPLIKSSLGNLPIGGLVSLYDDGKLKSIEFGDRTEYKITSGALSNLVIKESVGFYPEEKIAYIILNKPQMIKSNLGKIKVLGKVHFWENSNIKSAVLDDAQTLQTPGGILNLKTVEFYESGEFMGGLLDGGRREVNNVIIREPYIKFDKNGQSLGISDNDKSEVDPYNSPIR